jgi:hypothetical protein
LGYLGGAIVYLSFASRRPGGGLCFSFRPHYSTAGVQKHYFFLENAEKFFPERVSLQRFSAKKESCG